MLVDICLIRCLIPMCNGDNVWMQWQRQKGQSFVVGAAGSTGLSIRAATRTSQNIIRQ